MTNARNETAARLTSWFQRKTLPGAVRRIAAFPAALSSDVGVKRDENQDRVAIARGADASGRPYVLAAVSDGIGGMKDGAWSAAAALGNLFACLFDTGGTGHGLEPALKLAVRAANSTVHARLGGKGGATLSALLLCQGTACIVNVGDSRIYKYATNELSQLTVDDTIAGQLGHKVEADMGSNLLQFIGIGEALEVDVVQVTFDPDDMLLLTSDGVHYLDRALIAALVANAPDPGTALRRLTETSKWCGGHDNASAAILVPSAVLQHLTESCEDFCSIWDPFGELQLLQLRQRVATPAPAQVQPQAPKVQEADPAPLPPSSLSAIDKATKAKRKRDRKAKSTTQQEIPHDPETGQEKPKTPQLKIEFPQKAD